MRWQTPAKTDNLVAVSLQSISDVLGHSNDTFNVVDEIKKKNLILLNSHESSNTRGVDQAIQYIRDTFNKMNIFQGKVEVEVVDLEEDTTDDEYKDSDDNDGGEEDSEELNNPYSEPSEHFKKHILETDPLNNEG